MNDYERRQDSLKKRNRCKGCEHCKTVYVQNNWKIRGCYYKPNCGKWILEINKCPKESEV